jgi:hypothetical protein
MSITIHQKSERGNLSLILLQCGYRQIYYYLNNINFLTTTFYTENQSNQQYGHDILQPESLF